MKTCNDCQQVKPLEEFQVVSRNKDGRAGKCKPCKRAYDNAHYKSNPSRREYIKENSKNRIQAVRDYVNEYLRGRSCVDCGNTNPIVLEFDHRSDKSKNIGDMINQCSIASIKTEIAKCDIRCANCHRIKTAYEYGYYRTLPS